jgi:DNA-binding NtrC family response regulator
LSGGGEIGLEHLPADVCGVTAPETTPSAPLQALTTAVREFERQYLLNALRLAGGRRARTAELLGISRKNLWEKMRLHGISGTDVDEPVGPFAREERLR